MLDLSSFRLFNRRTAAGKPNENNISMNVKTSLFERISSLRFRLSLLATSKTGKCLWDVNFCCFLSFVFLSRFFRVCLCFGSENALRNQCIANRIIFQLFSFVLLLLLPDANIINSIYGYTSSAVAH